jgi:stage III sporulation protein SpoIIIAA
MSYSTLNLLLALLALIWFWRDNLRVREIAIQISRKTCQSHGVQLLDQTVALHRLSIRWLNSGLKLRRVYAFDYSLEGAGRRTGYIVMMGTHNISLHIDLPKQETDDSSSPI